MRSCRPVLNPYPDTRYEGVDLTQVRATEVSCATARRVAKRAHRKALAITPSESGLRRFNWNGWRVTGDLSGEFDLYIAERNEKRVHWRF
jgi:hypothetical protein